jgi:hypothetical protein
MRAGVLAAALLAGAAPLLAPGTAQEARQSATLRSGGLAIPAGAKSGGTSLPKGVHHLEGASQRLGRCHQLR